MTRIPSTARTARVTLGAMRAVLLATLVALAAAVPAAARPAAEPAAMPHARMVALREGRLVLPVDGFCRALRRTPSPRSRWVRQTARTGDRRVTAWFCGGPVRAVRTGWAKVSVEPRRAGRRASLGWVPYPAARLRVLPYTVLVRLHRQEAVVRHGRRVVRRIRLGIGRPAAPTTRGVTHVTARLRFHPGHRAYAVYGPHVLALGLPSSDGPSQASIFRGQGMLAFHAGAYGAVSLGCLHAGAADLRWMFAHLQPGTRVRIAR